MIRIVSLLGLVLALAAPVTLAQETGLSWKRTTSPAEAAVSVFRSPHVVNLETATTVSKGNLEFQIYHRFVPRISDGYDFLWGLDGPVNIRLGLGYAVSDRLTLTLGRSNVLGNLDLKAKYRLVDTRINDLPLMIAVQGAAAWNSNVPTRDDGDDRNFQYYAEGIFNVGLGESVALGFVPAYLYNADIFDPYRDSFIMGVYGQYYFAFWRRASVLVEWTGVVDGYDRGHNNLTLGLEVQTAGHFFKIVVTNGVDLNPALYLPGAGQSPDPDFWHLGFNITRLLPL